MPEPQDSCVKPAGGPLLAPPQTSSDKPYQPEVRKMTVQVGKPAPDFEATAFVEGGFKNVKLSDYKGKWIIICFYPGDFTFV